MNQLIDLNQNCIIDTLFVPGHNCYFDIFSSLQTEDMFPTGYWAQYVLGHSLEVK